MTVIDDESIEVKDTSGGSRCGAAGHPDDGMIDVDRAASTARATGALHGNWYYETNNG